MGQSFNVEGVLSLQDKGFSNTLKNAANSLNGFGKNAGSSFDGANRSMDGLSQKADQARSSILNIAAGIGAMQLVGKAVDMVKNSVSGAISRFDTLNQYPKVMEQLGYSAKDVSKSMDTLQNGIKGLPTALDDVVSTTQQFASITGDVDTAAKTTIALNDAFLASGSSAADAARGLQQYTQMLSSGKVDLMSWRTLQETMPSALKKVAEAFGYAGRSATNDLYAALQDGSITVDQLNQKFVELDSGVSGFASQARTASGGIQTSFDNLQNAVTRGMANMLTAIDKGLTSNGFPTMADNINKGQNLIDAGFQKLNGSIPGVISNFKNFGGSLSPLSGLLTAVSTGVMGLMAFSTIAPQLNATVIGLKNLGSAFSFILSPIGLIAAGIALLAVAFYKAYTTSEPFRQAIDNIAKTIHGGFDSAIQGISSGLQAMGVDVSSSTSVFQLFNDLLGTTKGQLILAGTGLVVLAAGIFALTGPIGLIVTAIAGAVGAVVAFLTTTKTGKTIVSTTVGFIQQAWQGLVDFLTTLFSSIGEFFTNVWNSIVTGLTPIISSIQNLWNTLVQFIQMIWTPIAPFFTALWSGIATIFTTVWTTIVTVVQTYMTIMQTIFQTGWQILVVVVQSVWTVISTVVSTALNVIASVIQLVMAVIQGDWGGAWNALVSIVSEVWNMISTVISTVLSAIVSIISSVLSAIASIWSSIWNGIMSVAQAIWDGIIAVIQASITAVLSVISAVLNSIKTFWTNTWNGIKSFAQDVWSGMKEALSNAMNAMRKIVSDVINSIKRLFDKLGDIDLGEAGRAIIKSFEKGLRSAFESVKKFIGGIGSWIKDHKGPIQYDRKLLIPAGNAIMGGLNGGLVHGFKEVKSHVSGMADRISELMQPDIGISNISGAINSANRQLQTGMQASVSGDMTLAAQPAYINLTMGGSSFSTFTDDITSQQDLNIQQRFGRGF
ncbi:phage tail protein [Companilactobacillus ginsenosidimutans]|uniref:phage tail protein n=1 Tax=Companilactobacillus ginsenosidimutans TaxID=1007676 RepID=UPI00066053F3|nr:tape measure protein [Companilactobacillus ginsenosidimutans]